MLFFNYPLKGPGPPGPGKERSIELYCPFVFTIFTERDVVDRIMANLINQDRSRRAVIKKMKEMGLISGVRELAKTKAKSKSGSGSSRPPKEWAEDEVAELERIFGEVRGSSDPLGLLVDRLSVRRSKKRIRDKILELRLVDNVTELRKKRSKKQKDKKGSSSGRILLEEGEEGAPSGPPSDSDGSSSSSDDESTSDEDEGGGDSDGSSGGSGRRQRRRKLYGFSQINVESFDPEALGPALRRLLDDGSTG